MILAVVEKPLTAPRREGLGRDPEYLWSNEILGSRRAVTRELFAHTEDSDDEDEDLELFADEEFAPKSNNDELDDGIEQMQLNEEDNEAGENAAEGDDNDEEGGEEGEDPDDGES